jgi:hypothetical protein
MIFVILCFVTFFKFGVGIGGYSLRGGPSRAKQEENPYCGTWLDNQDHDTCEISIPPQSFLNYIHFACALWLHPAAWTEKYRRDSDDIDNRYLQNLNRDPEFQVCCQT